MGGNKKIKNYKSIISEEIKELIINDYVENLFSIRDISKKYNIKSKTFIEKVLGDKKRTPSESRIAVHKAKPNSFKHTDKAKLKIKEARLKYMKEHPEKTAWRQKNLSYPEKCFIEILKEYDFNKKYLIYREYSVFPYFIDFDDVEYTTVDELVKSLTIKPAVAYTTFSHQQEGKGNRYRAIFHLNRQINDNVEYGEIVRCLAAMNKIEKYDAASESIYQLMHGTKKDARLIKTYNVIDLDTLDYSSYTKNKCNDNEPNAEEQNVIDYFKKNYYNTETIYLNQNAQNLSREINLPSDIRYVSDSWMKENGFAVNVFGYLYNIRNKKVKDGEHRRYRLFHIMKGIIQLNPTANLYNFLCWGYNFANWMCEDKLTRDEIINVVYGAYHSVKYCKDYDVKENFGHKKGYGVFPGCRSNVSNTQLLNYEYNITATTEQTINYIFEEDEEIENNRLGIDTDNMVLCTQTEYNEKENTMKVGDFFFFLIEKKKITKEKRDMSKYYQKKQNRISTFEEFKTLIDGFEDKPSTRKIKEFLNIKGFSINNKNLCEFVKRLKDN